MDKQLDRKAIIAIALCIAFIIGYQPVMRMLGFAPYLDPPRRARVLDSTRRTADTTAHATSLAGASNVQRSTGIVNSPGGPSAVLGAISVAAENAALERTVEIETPLYRAHFSNRGARLVSVELKRYASEHGATTKDGKRTIYHRGEEIPPGDRVTLAGGPLVALDLGSGSALQSLGNLVYEVEDSTDAAGAVRSITFTHRDTTGLSVRQTWRVRDREYALDYDVELHGVPAGWRLSDYSIVTRSWPLTTERDIASDARALRATSMVGTNIRREHAAKLLKEPKRFDGNALWAGVQNRYFLNGVAVERGTSRSVISSAERRDFSPQELSSLPAGTASQYEVAINSLVLGLPGDAQPLNKFVVYVGPCEYFGLTKLGLGLERAVDLGWSWLLPFSKGLLWLLNKIYGLVLNYGVAILLLATLVRLVLHPLNVTSMKSMRSMQRLQPEMNRLKEKYKNDPQAMNTATMALYKEHKVNPAGGCLPMVIQMPMFIALYNVLFNAIELRQAPFVAWINDLSAPDVLFTVAAFPIHVLPILMLGSGLLQQMLTPTAPDQKPTMYIMNVVMLVFFYKLPSGLVLYWTVMNLLTALQQWHVMRGDVGVQVMGTPVVATAGPGRKKGRS